MKFVFGIILLVAVVLASKENPQETEEEFESRIRRSAISLNGRAAAPNNNAKAGKGSSNANPRAGNQGANANPRASNGAANANSRAGKGKADADTRVNDEGRAMMMRALNATRHANEKQQNGNKANKDQKEQKDKKEKADKAAKKSG